MDLRQWADELIAQMTMEEKLGFLTMEQPGVPRLGIPEYHWWNEALHGVARNGRATMFPQSIALAATFTPKFAREEGEIIAREARIKYQYAALHGWRWIYAGLTMFSPNINIFRDPRWGRGHETYGEDIVLTSLFGSEYVKGVQGTDPDHLPCAATLKHYAVHSGPEHGRSWFNAEVSEQDLRQTYLYAFRYCLKHADAQLIMSAYNAVNGDPCSKNARLLRTILRDEWGFKGVVVTDVGTGGHLAAAHKVCKDHAEGLALELANGVDVCSDMNADADAREAGKRGLLKEEELNRAIRNQLILRKKLGLLDDPGKDLPDYSLLECAAHRAVSRKICERSMVLLKNTGILPLDPASFGKIAVIGPTADDRVMLVGNYEGNATHYVTILEGAIQLFGEDRIIYAPGCEYRKACSGDCCERPGDRYAEAVTAAEHADLVLLCVGLNADLEGEDGDASNFYAAGDKPSLELPEVQQELVRRIQSTGKKIILIHASGSAVHIPDEVAEAVLQVFYPGPVGGEVVMDVLSGKVNPSGRLPLTFYASSDDLPPLEDYAMKGRTYRYYDGPVQYPFGYGLSYSKFTLSHLSVPEQCALTSDVPCRVTVRCDGPYAGETTLLFFVRFEEGPSYKPLKQFAGAVRVSLKPGESREVEFSIDHEFLTLADEKGVFQEVAGPMTVMVEEEKATVCRQ